MGTLTGSIIGNWVSNAFYGILLTIDYVIYLAINICYQLFEVVSKVEVFSTENVGVISRRIYTIIGKISKKYCSKYNNFNCFSYLITINMWIHANISKSYNRKQHNW